MAQLTIYQKMKLDPRTLHLTTGALSTAIQLGKNPARHTFLHTHLINLAWIGNQQISDIKP